MKTTLYSLEGKALKQVELPEAFAEPVRDDLIKRAVLSDESKEYQPKGNYKFAGLETSAKYRGRKEMYAAVKNKGIPHLPHEVQPKGQFGKVKRVPHAVKGRRAHPPKPEKKLVEKLNPKEYKKALKSALAATAAKTVSSRYGISHDSYPIVLEKTFDGLKKTKEVVSVFDKLKLSQLIEKSKKKGNKNALIIVGEKGNIKSGKNIPGVDVVTPSSLKVKHLAPGCVPGRLMIITESALDDLKKVLA